VISDPIGKNFLSAERTAICGMAERLKETKIGICVGPKPLGMFMVYSRPVNKLRFNSEMDGAEASGANPNFVPSGASGG
jgi:hypothetical protein